MFSETPVDVRSSLLFGALKWDSRCVEGVTQDDLGKITCVSLLAHPFDGVNVNADVYIHVMVVAPLYTIFQEDPKGDVVMKMADTDTYDILNELGDPGAPPRFKTVRLKAKRFFSETAANAEIAPQIMEGCEEWYNNSHNVIDQFVYQRALMMCSVCDEKLSARLFDGEPVCPDCADVSLASSSDDKSSSTVRTPKVLNLDVLKSRALVHVKKGGDKIFCKPGHHVDEEYVIVSGGRNHELGFIAGNAALNQKAADAFLRSAKSAVFDIESVPVDSTLLRKIPDEIVSLQIVTDTGGAFGEPIIFTRRLPTCWDDGGLHDTAEFLKDVLTEEQIKGLRDKSGEVPLVKVFPVKSEKALVDGFVQFMKVYRPHFLVSYNGEGFDLKFLLRASVATEYADSLDDVLDHLKTNCVTRLNSMSRGLTPHIREGFKRGGWLCRGLISDERLEVDYTLFPCVIGVDLFKLEHCSLADACAKRNVSVGKLDAVKHKDIPRLYYGRDPKFWQYALLDPIATRELLNKLRFQAIEIYPTMEDLTGTPWNLSMSMKKTQNAVTTRMIQFMSRGFVTPAVIRPKRLLARHVVRLLADYYLPHRSMDTEKSLCRHAWATTKDCAEAWYRDDVTFVPPPATKPTSAGFPP